jgi:glutathione peroxidase
MRNFLRLAAVFLATLMTTHAQSLYEIPLKDIDGQTTTLAPFKGRVLLVVNVASECGYTPQYAGLQAAFEKYAARGLTVLGFPCNQFGAQEPGTGAEIKKFCTTNFRVTFPLFEKIDVNGAKRHALYAALAGKDSPFPGNVKWNFAKFLVGRDGKVVARFDADAEPDGPEITRAIEAALGKK